MKNLYLILFMLLLLKGFEPTKGKTLSRRPREGTSQVSTILPPFNFNANESLSPELVDEFADSMFHDYWEMYLRDNPETATSLGDHRYDDVLSRSNLKEYEKKKIMTNEFLERANQILPFVEEGSLTRDNLELFVTNLQFNLNMLLIGSHLFPVTLMYTPKMFLHFLLKYTPLNTSVHYWNLISRYRKFPQMIDDKIELMREGIRTNLTLHERSLPFDDNLEIRNPTDSPFYKPFLNISSLVPPDEAIAIQENGSEALMLYLYPSLKRLQDFMMEEYKKHTRPEIGLGTLPNGVELYHQELKYHLSDEKITPEDVHQMGLHEVERISREMEKVIHSLGYNLTIEEFSDYLRNDSSQYFESEEEVLETYRKALYELIYPRLSRLFKTIPKKKIIVEKSPSGLSGARAYYLKAPADGSGPAIFYIDASKLSELTKYEVITLALHEGVPGHHLQISYAMEQENIPDFRKYELNNNAYIEGWALYAEYLGYELGLYEDPYMNYGHLSEEIFRACRMVVDTGMHVFGWTREKAINFMKVNTAATLGNIEREVDRYISWPGQACAYKYGEIKIKNLRKMTEEALGPAFDIKKFHDIVLQNAGPMDFLEKKVLGYISSL